MENKIKEKIDTFFKQYSQKKYKKGEIVIRADEDPSGIFYVIEGQIKEYAITRKGDELVVNIFKPQSFFPMSWGMNNTPNAYFYEAMTDLIIYKAPRDEVLTFIKNNSDVLYDLLRRVYTGVDGIFTRMTYLMSGDAYTRLITELIISANRFGKKEKDTIIVHISEKDLATQSGMTRETVSREMKILKEKGIVHFEPSTLIIKDLSLLESELGIGV